MKSVVLCGSKRYKPEMREFAKSLRELGCEVFEPHLTNFGWANIPTDYKDFIALGLTHDHFFKIRMADVVYVYNKEGYAGNSVTLEIGYAAALNKPIYAYAKDEEHCRHVLFRDFLTTPEELIKRLS